MAGKWIFALLLACLINPVNAQPNLDTPRGELMYATHCIACHNDKIHWRDKKIASNWATLKAQVNRWQAIQGLLWNDTDAEEVAHFLNTHFYNYPEHVQ